MFAENDDKKVKNTRTAYGRFLNKEIKIVLSGSGRATRRK